MAIEKDYASKTGYATLQIIGLKKQASVQEVIEANKEGKLVEFLINLSENDFTNNLKQNKNEINKFFQDYFFSQSFRADEKMENAHIYYPKEQGLNLIMVAVLDIMFDSQTKREAIL